ncbi:hypothetical protein Patl1_22546 [Pistacia atlantica]|uniref:Uncharacterized protein n=1 Tax=Pistacia atlantica TaxID=434234 RepID=A0ACC1A2R4_9ROSI|nr:hypothetical protein Patl1_22546 [Pistacia atlantica]
MRFLRFLKDMAAKVKMMQDHDHHQKSWTAARFDEGLYICVQPPPGSAIIVEQTNGGEMVKELITRLWSEYKYFAKTMAVIVRDHSSLQKSLHDLIDEERERKEIDHDLNKKFLEFLAEMRLDKCSVNYYSKFEQMMLEETSKCYHQLSLEYRSQPDLFIDYIQKEEEKVKALYSEEDNPTRRKLLKIQAMVLSDFKGIIQICI